MAVFINMPFDPTGKYRDLMVAYVAGVTGMGATPRSVLEIGKEENRLERLLRIIGQCDTSLHDLSCVGGSVPRFNMPFELGVCLVVHRNKWLVFEEEDYRLQRTLSDVNGHDPHIHNGDPETLLSCLRDCFTNPRGQPTLVALKKLHVAVNKAAKNLEREHGHLLKKASWDDLVVVASHLAQLHGLI